jgi:hypothetical protein
MDTIINFDSLDAVFLYIAAFFGAFIVAVWLSLIIWTYRDIRSRSRDRVLQILSTLIVALLTIPGMVVYLILRPKSTLDETYQKTLEEEALLTAIESKNICPGCSAELRDDWQICAFCHTRIKKICVECSRLLELPWQICPYCATPTPGSPHTVVELEEDLPPDDTEPSDDEVDVIDDSVEHSFESNELTDDKIEEEN